MILKAQVPTKFIPQQACIILSIFLDGTHLVLNKRIGWYPTWFWTKIPYLSNIGSNTTNIIYFYFFCLTHEPQQSFSPPNGVQPYF
jgi:hypothetical protein